MIGNLFDEFSCAERIASNVLMVLVSVPSLTAMTERALEMLTIVRSAAAQGSPRRATKRVVFKSPIESRSCSSISVLSTSAKMTTAAFLRLSFARINSLTIDGTRGDQPRMIV